MPPTYAYMDTITTCLYPVMHGAGTNRLATLLLFLSEADEGGQTIFPDVRNTSKHARTSLRTKSAQGHTDSTIEPDHVAQLRSKFFSSRSWQSGMTTECYTGNEGSLAVWPKRGDAVMFYLQQPSGELDRTSLHGGCPVLSGTKWSVRSLALD